tara:strand:- start:303 stop:545 length:243 start_codon:yes stop_codon:yes gene_type:complete
MPKLVISKRKRPIIFRYNAARADGNLKDHYSFQTALQLAHFIDNHPSNIKLVYTKTQKSMIQEEIRAAKEGKLVTQTQAA